MDCWDRVGAAPVRLGGWLRESSQRLPDQDYPHLCVARPSGQGIRQGWGGWRECITSHLPCCSRLRSCSGGESCSR